MNGRYIQFMAGIGGIDKNVINVTLPVGSFYLIEIKSYKTGDLECRVCMVNSEESWRASVKEYNSILVNLGRN